VSEYQRHKKQQQDDSFFCRFTFGQFFSILLLEVFTLFFVFYLGAKYGADFLGLPVSLEASQTVADSPSDYSPKLTVQTTDDPEVLKLAQELMDKAKTPELKERIAAMLQARPTQDKVDAMKQEAVQIVKNGVEVKQEAATENMVAEKIEASPSEEVADSPDATPSGVVRVKSSDSARYSIQVGSYPELPEANGIVEKWKKLGYPAYMMIADIPDRGRWYRVRIGGFNSKDEASGYLSDLNKREGVEALVVLNEQ